MKCCKAYLMLIAAAAALALIMPAFAQDTKEPAKKKEKKKEEVFKVDGKLTAKDPLDTHRAGRHFKVHEYKMTTAKVYVIDLIDPTKSRWDPYLRVEDSKGAILAEHDDIVQGIDQNARIAFSPTKEDTYRIIATSCDAGRTGPYTLTIRPIDRGAAPVAGVQHFDSFQVPVDIGDLSITALPLFGKADNSGQQQDGHGYVEYRFIIENNSETTGHTVKLSIPRHANNFRYGHYLKTLRKTVDVGPGDRAVVSIFQPDLPIMGNDVEVEIDGKPQQQSVSGRVANNRGNRSSMFFGGGRGGLFPTVLLPNDNNFAQKLRDNIFKSAVGVVTKGPTSGSYSSRGGQWQEPGPHYNKMYNYHDIHRFQMSLDHVRGWSTHWLGYSSFDGVALTSDVLAQAPGSVQSALWQYVECGGTLLIIGQAKVPPGWERTKETLPGFVRYYPGFGQCVVATKRHFKTKEIDIASWDPEEWRLVTGMWESYAGAWQQVRTPTEANKEFPIVEGIGIPVRGLFVVMFLFVVLIGPVNIYWLARSKRRLWLLWTVPIFSIITCVLLIGYMIATEGWHGHARVAGITVLDETSQRAATIGWQGYYCPVTPAGGLRFSLDTELTPHLDARGRHSPRRFPHTVEWADEQVLSEGWVNAKVPIHFMTRRSLEKQLFSVNLQKDDDGSLHVVNHLGADIESIQLAAADGQVWAASAILAGAKAKLQPTERKAAGSLDQRSKIFTGLSWPKSMEQMTDRPGPAAFLVPGCYIAVLDESPFLEQGLRQTQSRNLRSVVYGIMKE